MNAKKSKAMRCLARIKTIGHQAVQYRPMTPVRIFADGDVLKVGKSAIWTGQATLTKDCTRAVYHQLKRESRA